MDERLFFNSVEAMRLDVAGGIPSPLLGATPESVSRVPLLLVESKLVHSSRVPPLVEEAASVKVAIKQTPSARDFLRRGFLNSSLVEQVLLKVSVILLSTLVANEDEVVRTPPHLGSCVSPTVDKGEDLRVNGLIESQKWPVGFGLSGEVVVRDPVWDGEDGVSSFPLGVYLPDMHLDWPGDCEEDEVLLLDILDASVSEEEFLRKSMVARQKTKGRREVLNLKNSINYGDDYATSWHRKSKTHKM
jgi:hypothetical protein